MAQLGLDVEQVQGLVTTLRNQVDAVNQLRSTVDGVVAATWWNGGDADQFRNDWATFNTQLLNISTAFDNTASAAQHQLDEQQQASGT